CFCSLLGARAANLFVAVPTPPREDRGPNPRRKTLVLMIVPPPMLYLGYVGMTIPFGLAMAALLRKRLGHSFLRPLRAALLLPWIFLTITIMLGGWWAYEVLGWGGYRAWGPVENRLLLPWLTAAAAVPSAAVVGARG